MIDLGHPIRHRVGAPRAHGHPGGPWCWASVSGWGRDPRPAEDLRRNVRHAGRRLQASGQTAAVGVAAANRRGILPLTDTTLTAAAEVFGSLQVFFYHNAPCGRRAGLRRVRAARSGLNQHGGEPGSAAQSGTCNYEQCSDEHGPSANGPAGAATPAPASLANWLVVAQSGFPLLALLDQCTARLMDYARAIPRRA